MLYMNIQDKAAEDSVVDTNNMIIMYQILFKKTKCKVRFKFLYNKNKNNTRTS